MALLMAILKTPILASPPEAFQPSVERHSVP
jgi:hypothetical protein